MSQKLYKRKKKKEGSSGVERKYERIERKNKNNNSSYVFSRFFFNNILVPLQEGNFAQGVRKKISWVKLEILDKT